MKIAVIGAGITGISAANLLTSQNIEVEVFEKSRGLGGRMATKRLEWADIDIGAQYFTARNDAFHKQLTSWENNHAVSTWNFTPYKVDEGQLSISADNTTRFVGAPKMNSPVHSLAKNIKVHTGCKINKLDKEASNTWRLLNDNGEQFASYDWVLSTMPCEQCLPLFDGHATFVSDMPTTIHQPRWAVALATRGQVNDDIQGIFGDNTVSWVSRLSSRPQRASATSGYEDLWMLHFSPAWTQANGKQTDPVNIAFEWLCNTLDTTLELVNSYAHYWRFASVDPNTTPPGVFIDTQNKLAAAGAWCTGGRVEGGYISAVEIVNRIKESS